MRGAVIAALCGIQLVIPAPAVAEAAVPRLNEVNCEGTDWVEIVNPSGTSLDVGGWLLTDDPTDLQPPRSDHRYTFPSPTEISPGGHLVVERGTDGFPFGVSCGADTLRLADTSGVLADVAAIPTMTALNLTYGRLPDGSGPWEWTASTPNAGNVAAPDAPADPDSSWLYDPMTVTEFDLAVEPANLAALTATPDAYVAARMTVTRPDSAPLTLDVGLRLKGSGSFRTLAAKAAFKIKVTYSVPGQRLEGLKELTLNNMVQDPSMIAEATSSHVMRGLGLPAPRVGYAFVRLNGAAYGVYANVETVDAVFAARHFASTQHIYENSELGADVTPAGAALLEVDEGSESDRADLAAVVTAAGAPAPTWWSSVSPLVDMPRAVRMWAAEHLIAQLDGYSVPPYGPNNFYLHSDTAGRFTFIPSGTDRTWTDPFNFGTVGAGALMRACVADATCTDAYVETLATLRPVLDGNAWADFAGSVALQLRPWQSIDPRKESTTEEIATSLAAKQNVMRTRAAALDDWLASPTFPMSAAPSPGAGGGAGGSETGDSAGAIPLPFGRVGLASPIQEAAPAVPLPPTGVAAVSRATGRARLIVVGRSASSTVKAAPRLRIRTGTAVRLSIAGLPAGRVGVDIRDGGTWLRMGPARRVSEDRRESSTFRIARPGNYLVRLNASPQAAFLMLVVAP